MKSFRNNMGKILGALHDDGIFRKEVSGSKHLYKNEQAWGMDKVVLDELPARTIIRIRDKETTYVYETDVETFRSGTPVDFGYGYQILLWKGLFDCTVDGVKTESDYKGEWREQMQLWDSIEESSNGRTADSESANSGSNPGSSA